MKRGEIWTIAGGPGYAGTPRPAVIIQDDGFSETLSIAVCLLTSEPIEAPMLRILVERSGRSPVVPGLMVDKIITVPKSCFGQCIGRLADADVLRLNRSLLVFLGLAR